MYYFTAFCIPDGTITIRLTVNSQNLMNTVNFENNKAFYFTSKTNLIVTRLRLLSLTFVHKIKLSVTTCTINSESANVVTIHNNEQTFHYHLRLL